MILESAEWYNFELLTQDPSKTRVGIRRAGDRHMKEEEAEGLFVRKYVDIG